MRSSRASWIPALAVAVAALLAGGTVAIAGGERERGSDPAKASAPGVWPPVRYPSRRAVLEAQRFIAARGDSSFALIDSRGRLLGYDADRRYSSASASKSLLLAAELLRLRRKGEPLDSATRSLLEPMITYSDNRAASGVYARVGDAGLQEVARRAGMRGFEVDPGFWGGAQITAADMARFFYRLDRNLAGRYRRYGKHLLASVTSAQRWGIPAAAGRGWRIWFKGGWRPAGQEGTTGAVTHQAALLVHRDGHRLGLAVLTNEAPGAGGGYDAIEGVTTRLLGDPPRIRRWLAP